MSVRDVKSAFNRLPDPTYVREQIEADPKWALAFRMSEVDNDDAPIGWYRYVPLASWLLYRFELTEKKE